MQNIWKLYNKTTFYILNGSWWDMQKCLPKTFSAAKKILATLRPINISESVHGNNNQPQVTTEEDVKQTDPVQGTVEISRHVLKLALKSNYHQDRYKEDSTEWTGTASKLALPLQTHKKSGQEIHRIYITKTSMYGRSVSTGHALKATSRAFDLQSKYIKNRRSIDRQTD